MTKPITKTEVIRRLTFGGCIPRNWRRDFPMRMWQNKSTKEIITEKEVYELAVEHRCQTCGEITPDIRHITVDCFYELKEMSDLFEMHKLYNEANNSNSWRWAYTILVCKGCRSIFVDFLGEFINTAKKLKQDQNIDTEGIRCIG